MSQKRSRRRVTRYPHRINFVIDTPTRDSITEIADRFALPESEVMRLALVAGLPTVERRLARERDSD